VLRICWIISQDIPNNLIDPVVIKDTGTSWGSWLTHSIYSPDNCICSNTTEAKALIQHSIQDVCTLYIMKESYSHLGKPAGVKLFNGQFKNNLISNKDDIIALNLAVPEADLVLLAGFNFGPLLNTDEKGPREARLEYYFNVREIIQGHPQTQFVLVEYTGGLASWAQELDNLTEDTVESVKNLLG
jgi:hypothetical protein